jgi:hypothetical protein
LDELLCLVGARSANNGETRSAVRLRSNTERVWADSQVWERRMAVAGEGAAEIELRAQCCSPNVRTSSHASARPFFCNNTYSFLLSSTLRRQSSQHVVHHHQHDRHHTNRSGRLHQPRLVARRSRSASWRSDASCSTTTTSMSATAARRNATS